MKIEVTEYASKGLVAVATTHGNEPMLAWDARNYDRSGQSDVGALPDALDPDKYGRIFADINAFWASLPQERQDAIWEVYKQIHNVLMTNYDSTSILGKLQVLVKQLYDYMPIADIKHWMLFHSGIRVPATVKSEYGPDDSPVRTYLTADYQDLIALSIAVRPMVPIWGEYIGRTKTEFGTTYKELWAMKLLYHTNLIVSDQIRRLQAYIEASMDRPDQQASSFAAIMGGLGTTEQPEWLLATSVVRRISVVPLGNSQEEGANIIANVHQYITNSLRSMDRRFKGRITEKTQPSASGEDPNNISSAEMYKVKQQISDGDVVTLNVYTENVWDMAAKVEPDMPRDLIERCIAAVRALEPLAIQPHQVTLAQWVMTPALPEQTIQQLTKPSLLRVLAVTQATLWHWGLYDLAALVTAEPLSMGSDLMIGVLESRGRIPKELMDTLVVLFPHAYHARGKNQSIRQTNPASRSVDAFCELIVRTDWRLHAPEQLVAASSATGNTKKLIVPADIRAMLARLIIRLTSPLHYA
jgi:hypothetical protein